MTGKKKSNRSIAMSDMMKSIKLMNPGLTQTQILTLASKKLSRQNKTGKGLNLAPPRGSGMYLKPYK
jgi:hypothetical protein